MLFWKLLAIHLSANIFVVESISPKKIIWNPLYWKRRIFTSRNEERSNSVPSVSGWIENFGYTAETHTVRTEDGYLLAVHRIPCPVNCGANHRRQPVLLTHGFIASSVIWVVGGPGKDLAFDLADAGYDVWLGNWRGNTYSRYHESLSDKDFKFWDFSWDEMGQYDLPAMIDHIYGVKSQEHPAYSSHDLICVGHSMGGTVLAAALSTMPEYNPKIRAAILLAPAIYMAGVGPPFSWMAPYSIQLQAMIRLTGQDDFLSHKSKEKYSATLYCQYSKKCENVILQLADEDTLNYDVSVLMALTEYLPAGTSTRTVRHFAQLINNNGKFQKYDYGRYQNLLAYGRAQPPSYNLSAITTPIAIFYSDADIMATPDNVKRVFSELTVTIGLFKADAMNFGHMEFTLGRRAPELVNRPMLKIMKDFR